ncbi:MULTISPECIES: hypothetical protein [Pseudomonas]|jgi:hypothetical protein|uniref:hypothetical protein n=1 Tax=Pseudomonas TaxID=286 RepID=UPI000358217B|nr:MULTISPECIES: hypothetical protein [Pseudomonas]EPJ87621.1 hypothetical protein CFII64_07350 [Pseudomonas sp. CFII64]
MKTTMTFFAALLVAALSASALAMPCGQNRQTEEVMPSNNEWVRLNVAQARTVRLLPAI